MRCVLTVVGAAAVLLLGASCAGPRDEPVDPGAGPPVVTTLPPPPAPPSSDGSLPPGGQLVAPEKIDRSGLPRGYPVKVWTEGDGRTIGLVAQEGGCGKAGAEIAEQSAAAVTLLTFEAVPKEPKMCTMDLRYPTLSVTLDEPLGDRTVVLRHERRTY